MAKRQPPKPDTPAVAATDAASKVQTSGHLESTAVVATDAGSNVRTVRTFEFGDADVQAAASLGIVIAGSAEDRVNRAVQSYNMAARLAVESGYLLLSVKAEVQHGQFLDGVEALGLTRQRAAELMRMAKFATSLPEERRSEFLMLPKSKVLALAAADQEVVEVLLEEGAEAVDALTVRELAARLRQSQAELADAETARQRAEAQAKAAQKRLEAQANRSREDGVPLVVADLRAEVAALKRKAELAIGSFHQVGVELVEARALSGAHEWVDPTVHMAVAGLVSVRLMVDAAITKYSESFGIQVPDINASLADIAYCLTDAELVEAAAQYQRIARVHEYEAALRKWEREKDRPRGKGRPASKPTHPDEA